MGAVISFIGPALASHGTWSQQDLAEFYRVEAALIRAGIGVVSEHGVSDEGEPWFVFCRPNGDAIMHFARIDGGYVIASEVLERTVRGPDFRALIDQVARMHPALLPITAVGTTRLVVHPAALLAALVAAAALSLSSEDAHAGEFQAGPVGALPTADEANAGSIHSQPRPIPAGSSAQDGDQGAGRSQFAAMILSVMVFAAETIIAPHLDPSAGLDLRLAADAGTGTSSVGQGEVSFGSSVALGSESHSLSAPLPTPVTAHGSGGADPGSSSGGPGRAGALLTLRMDLQSEPSGALSQDRAHLPEGLRPDADIIVKTAELSVTRAAESHVSITARSESPAGSSEKAGLGRADQHGSTSGASAASTSSQVHPVDAAQPRASAGGAEHSAVNTGSQISIGSASPASATNSAAGANILDGGHSDGDAGALSHVSANMAPQPLAEQTPIAFVLRDADGATQGNASAPELHDLISSVHANGIRSEPVSSNGSSLTLTQETEVAHGQGPSTSVADVNAAGTGQTALTSTATEHAASGDHLQANTQPPATTPTTGPITETAHATEATVGQGQSSDLNHVLPAGSQAPVAQGPDALNVAVSAEAKSAPTPPQPESSPPAHIPSLADTAGPADHQAAEGSIAVPPSSHEPVQVASEGPILQQVDGGSASGSSVGSSASLTLPQSEVATTGAAAAGSEGQHVPVSVEHTEEIPPTTLPQTSSASAGQAATPAVPSQLDSNRANEGPAVSAVNQAEPSQAGLSSPASGAQGITLNFLEGAPAAAPTPGSVVNNVTSVESPHITPVATVDPSGNLVFHTDSPEGAPPTAASPLPSEPAEHPDMGLVGLTELSHTVYELYHPG